MEKEQAREWAEAQTITFSVDLVEAAKTHLKFLDVVDQHPYLYEDHALKRAVYRYNAFWLPLLAKHLESPVIDGEPLVVPLDCEWIWHCHRLNPLRYIRDCETMYGRLLGNQNVISSVIATSKSKSEEIWSRMYPEEPYELDMSKPFSEEDLKKGSENAKFTSYDLIAAVKRQMSFTYQICKPYTTDDLYLQEAVRRYKGFLHMVRLNDEKNRECFCVPTYDIDLVWHTHQLDPVSYSKDMTENVGRVCHHNDKVSDRTPGKLLHVGFCDITNLWEETYGKSYWTAGTLHRGTPPAPVTQFPVNFIEDKKLSSLNKFENPILFPSLKVVEVLLEFKEIKNLPAGHGNLTVYFSKKQADKIFKAKRSLGISSELGEKQVVSFHCEPKGEFLFELMSNSLGSNKPKILGTYSFSLQELVASGSQLATDTWLSLEPVPGNITSSETILLHASISFTPPVPAPLVFRLAGSSQPFPIGKDAKLPRQVMDLDGNQLFTLDMWNIEKGVTKWTPGLKKEVCFITETGEKHKLAEFIENHWSIKGSNGSLKLQNSSGNDDSLFELVGCKMVKFYPGRRLDFEAEMPMEKQTLEQGFLTAVEFSVEKPYGKAIALIDFMSKTMKSREEWMILPGITVAYLVTEILKEEIDFKGWNTKQGISETGEFENIGKKGTVVNSDDCRDCGIGCDHLDMVQTNGFADCAKCYQCGVLAGDENDGMAGADLGNKLKTDGAAACLMCHLCTGRLAADKFADCANCYQCGVKSGGGNDGNGYVVGGGGEIGNMENYADLGNKLKTDGAAACLMCHLCTGRLAADKFADCAKCYQCGVKSGGADDGNGDN